MLEQFRAVTRQKLQNAVAEVVSESERRRADHDDARNNALAERLEDRLDSLAAELATVRRSLADLERSARRDIGRALDVGAAQESAAFVVAEMAQAERFAAPAETLRFALTETKVDGLVLEFGVASGGTLRIISDAVPQRRPVYGFDVFTGLPETWRTGFPAGEFAQETVPEVHGAEIVAGLFEDTLPDFLAARPGPVAFLHLDADLYSSTKTVLDLVADRLVPGSVIVFDEFFNFPGWREHEFRAWTEFTQRTGVRFEYLAYTVNDEQVVARIV